MNNWETVWKYHLIESSSQQPRDEEEEGSWHIYGIGWNPITDKRITLTQPALSLFRQQRRNARHEADVTRASTFRQKFIRDAGEAARRDISFAGEAFITARRISLEKRRILLCHKGNARPFSLGELKREKEVVKKWDIGFYSDVEEDEP